MRMFRPRCHAHTNPPLRTLVANPIAMLKNTADKPLSFQVA